MKKITIFLIVLLCMPVLAQDAINNCFKVGDNWHNITLPSDMKNVRWLFGDDDDQTPFMSITFDIDSQHFEGWALTCGVNLNKVKKNHYWILDIQEKYGGTVSVVKYTNDRYCIGIERTSRSGVEKKVDGKPYLGCPTKGSIDY